MAKKKVRIKKPTKLEELTIATRQDYSHLHSASIRAKRELYQFEEEQVENRITALKASLQDANQRKKQLNAMIIGLGLILERR